MPSTNTDIMEFIVGSPDGDGKKLTALFGKLVAIEGSKFGRPPRMATEEGPGNPMQCESFIDSNGKTVFIVKPEDMSDVAVEDKEGSVPYKRNSSECGVNFSLDDDGTINIKLRNVPNNPFSKVFRVGVRNSIDLGSLMDNGGDINSRWSSVLSAVTKPSEVNSKEISFKISPDELKKMSPQKRAFLLKNLSDSADLQNYMKGLRGISAYDPRKTPVKAGAEALRDFANSGATVFLFGHARVLYSYASKGLLKGKPFTGFFYGARRAVIDMGNLVKNTLGLGGFIKRVQSLSGGNRIKYVASKIFTAPTNLIGGASIDRAYYNYLLKKECLKDLVTVGEKFNSETMIIKERGKGIEKTKEQGGVSNKQQKGKPKEEGGNKKTGEKGSVSMISKIETTANPKLTENKSEVKKSEQVSRDDGSKKINIGGRQLSKNELERVIKDLQDKVKSMSSVDDGLESIKTTNNLPPKPKNQNSAQR